MITNINYSRSDIHTMVLLQSQWSSEVAMVSEIYQNKNTDQ